MSVVHKIIKNWFTQIRSKGLGKSTKRQYLRLSLTYERFLKISANSITFFLFLSYNVLVDSRMIDRVGFFIIRYQNKYFKKERGSSREFFCHDTFMITQYFNSNITKSVVKP